jgi:transcriptional regulator with XRE-family HTH domain/tetratricopeptide (TPR) repeat protein
MEAMTEQAIWMGSELRRRRLAAGISLADMAMLVHYSKSHLSKVETGVKVASPDLAQRCDAALDADGSLSKLVSAPIRHRAVQPQPEDTSEGIFMELLPEGSNKIGVVRRQVLLGGATLMSGATLLNTWVLGPSSPSGHGDETLASFLSIFRDIRKLGQSTSPSALAPIVVANAQALQALAAGAAPRTRSQFLVLSSHFATYAGWMAQESGDVAAAEAWTDRGAALATVAGDRDLAAYSFVRRALIALNQHDAIETIQLARRALDQATSARVRGLALQREAQGHAIGGDYRACLDALDRASALLSASTVDQAHPVIGTSMVADPAAMVHGWCLHDLGRPDEAARILEQELHRIPTSAIRARARFGARLALAQASRRDLEQARATLEPVLAAVNAINSATVRLDLRRLAQTLNRWHGEPIVRDLQPRLLAGLHPRD